MLINLFHRLSDIEKRHRLDAKNSALLRAMAAKRLAKYGGGPLAKEKSAIARNNSVLRRAHSHEELFSEVGFKQQQQQQQQDENNNNSKRIFDNGVQVLPDFFAAKLRKGKVDQEDSSNSLRVSDEPSVNTEFHSTSNSRTIESHLTPNSRRVRRNSAGDEINSILNHDLSMLNNPNESSSIEYDMSRLAMNGSRPECYDPYGRNNDAENDDDDDDEKDRTATSISSLNTTVVANNSSYQYEEMNLGLLVPPMLQSPSSKPHEDGNLLIRPIPGRPANKLGPPPVPGPKPQMAFARPATVVTGNSEEFMHQQQQQYNGSVNRQLVYPEPAQVPYHNGYPPNNGYPPPLLKSHQNSFAPSLGYTPSSSGRQIRPLRKYSCNVPHCFTSNGCLYSMEL